MVPTAAVCGLYFSHQDSRHFGLGKINKDQLTNYAHHEGFDIKEMVNLQIGLDDHA
ncbi:MAG: hypothetical protein IH836_00475 [Proteobacteria bacterium]|nr:hypothetical protein [Pseudomonadota bacterium]